MTILKKQYILCFLLFSFILSLASISFAADDCYSKCYQECQAAEGAQANMICPQHCSSKCSQQPSPDQDQSAEDAAESGQSSANEWADTYPFSNPNALSQIASWTVQSVADEANRDLFAFRLGQQSKTSIVLKIVSIMQKYKTSGENPSPFDKMLDEFNKQNEEIAKQAKEFSGGGEGDALPHIAGLLGVEVQQLSLQNMVLIELNRTILSEILLLEHIAYMDIETYRSNISGTLTNAFNIYEKILSPTH